MVSLIKLVSFLSNSRFGMSYPIKKQCRLCHLLRTGRSRQSVWWNVLSEHGNAREEGLQWMIFQL